MAVIDNNFETQGTHLYFVDTVTSTIDEVVKLTCPTSIPGVGGGSKDRIDTTCLDNTTGYRTYIAGMADTTEITIPFVLYKGDGSHQALPALRDSNEVVGWYVGLSDDDDAPTADSDGDLVSPASRTGFSFRASIQNLVFNIDGNEVVRGELTLLVTGATTVHWAA